MTELKLAYFGHIKGSEDSSEKNSVTGKNRKHQEKKKTEDEMDWLQGRSHGRESTGAERGC